MTLNLRYDAESALQDIQAGVAHLQHLASKPESREALLAHLPEIDRALADLQAVRQLVSPYRTQHEAA